MKIEDKVCNVFKIWSDGAEKNFLLFPYPTEEPKYSDPEVGKSLMLTPMLMKGQIQEAVSKSEVKGLFPDVTSYSGFLTVNNQWESNIFFWLFIADVVEPSKAPLIIWLQGGPGSTSLFGLFNENGPFLVDVEELPDINPYLVKNKHSWHNFANMLYIDSPVGTGFSYANDSENHHTSDSLVSIDLMAFLFQFLKIYPHYVKGKENPRIFLFGESYSGTVVANLASYLVKIPNFKEKMRIEGIGIGNGFVR